MRMPGFVPEDLRQLARFVPLRGWDAVEWKPLMRSLQQISFRFVTGRGIKRLANHTTATTPGIQIVSSIERDAAIDEVDAPSALQRVGDELLKLYFAQFLVDEGLFLDLRSSRLGLAEETLQFAPNGLWIQLRSEFREGMLALYRSFYGADDQAFEDALRQMGMLPEELSEEAASELKELLYVHFGVQQDAQHFSIDNFKQSFDQLFEFFTRHDYKLHSDFVFVGFYLITLYLTLEKCGQAYDVRGICAEVLLADEPTRSAGSATPR